MLLTEFEYEIIFYDDDMLLFLPIIIRIRINLTLNDFIRYEYQSSTLKTYMLLYISLICHQISLDFPFSKP